MKLPDLYFDIGPALTGGYRVIVIRDRAQQLQAIFDTARDVVAAARICGAAVLTEDVEIRQIARASGVRVLERSGG